MAHHVALLFQFFLFTFYEACLREFVELKLQEVEVLAVLLDIGLHLLKFFACGLNLFESDLIVGQFFLVASDDIDHAQLEILFVEQQVLVLGVDIDEAFAEFLEHGELYGRVVDEGSTLTG